MKPPFQLPDESVITSITDAFPCREPQIRSLATLLHVAAAPAQNLVLYGTASTGKSATTEALLQALAAQSPAQQNGDTQGGPEEGERLQYAILNSVQCITARHLFERTLASVASSLSWESIPKKCETVSQLNVELSKMLKYTQRPEGWRFVLVFDAIDRQRDAPATLLPALARLPEIIPCLTCVFVLTGPPAGFLRTLPAPHIQFPNYNKSEFVKILSSTPPESKSPLTKDDVLFLWPRFCTAVHDALISSASRTLPALRHACGALWPKFIAPIHANTHGPREFTKLVIASRLHFQDEALLNPSIISVARPSKNKSTGNTASTAADTKPTSTNPSSSSTAVHQPPTPDLAALLPTTARLLLLSAYLASHNAARHDLTLFSTYHHGRRKRRGGGYAAPRQNSRSKHRKIARKLLGAHAFVLERMLAIFAAVRSEWVGDENLGGNVPASVGAGGLDGDVGMALSTLASLRLLVRVGAAADPLDKGGKWRINVGWEIIRGVGRSIGVEVEEWLIE